jgi:hypothetical protein
MSFIRGHRGMKVVVVDRYKLQFYVVCHGSIYIEIRNVRNGHQVQMILLRLTKLDFEAIFLWCREGKERQVGKWGSSSVKVEILPESGLRQTLKSPSWRSSDTIDTMNTLDTLDTLDTTSFPSPCPLTQHGHHPPEISVFTHRALTGMLSLIPSK